MCDIITTQINNLEVFDVARFSDQDCQRVDDPFYTFCLLPIQDPAFVKHCRSMDHTTDLFARMSYSNVTPGEMPVFWHSSKLDSVVSSKEDYVTDNLGMFDITSLKNYPHRVVAIGTDPGIEAIIEGDGWFAVVAGICHRVVLPADLSGFQIKSGRCVCFNQHGVYVIYLDGEPQVSTTSREGYNIVDITVSSDTVAIAYEKNSNYSIYFYTFESLQQERVIDVGQKKNLQILSTPGYTWVITDRIVRYDLQGNSLTYTLSQDYVPGEVMIVGTTIIDKKDTILEYRNGEISEYKPTNLITMFVIGNSWGYQEKLPQGSKLTIISPRQTMGVDTDSPIVYNNDSLNYISLGIVYSSHLVGGLYTPFQKVGFVLFPYDSTFTIEEEEDWPWYLRSKTSKLYESDNIINWYHNKVRYRLDGGWYFDSVTKEISNEVAMLKKNIGRLYDDGNLRIIGPDGMWETDTHVTAGLGDSTIYVDVIYQPDRLVQAVSKNGLFMVIVDQYLTLAFNAYNSHQFQLYTADNNRFSTAIGSQQQFCWNYLWNNDGFLDARCACLGGEDFLKEAFNTTLMSEEQLSILRNNTPCLMKDCSTSCSLGQETNACVLYRQQCGTQTIQICEQNITATNSHFNNGFSASCGFGNTCKTTADCPLPSICIGGACRQQCANDGDCGKGVCRNGRCRRKKTGIIIISVVAAVVLTLILITLRYRKRYM
jgi:hypothetical protein